ALPLLASPAFALPLVALPLFAFPPLPPSPPLPPVPPRPLPPMPPKPSPAAPAFALPVFCAQLPMFEMVLPETVALRFAVATIDVFHVCVVFVVFVVVAVLNESVHAWFVVVFVVVFVVSLSLLSVADENSFACGDPSPPCVAVADVVWVMSPPGSL